jgi:predicted ATPase
MLRRGWSAVAAGASRIALIEGEPGVGKTRLADDFLHWVASQGGVVLRGRGYDAHAGAPFGAVIEALHSAVDAPGVAGVDPEWLGEIGRVLPEIRRRFSGLPEAAAANVATDGWRLFEAIAQVLLAISEDSPIAILIDDLQWCDADSCSLLHFLVRRLADARVLWCATFTLGEIERDAPAARLARALRAARDSTCVVLSSLSEDDVWRLIRELARVDAPDGARRLAGRIHEATAGNPFYVIELLKTLFARELLTVDAITEAWIVQPAAMTDTVPEAFSPTVHDAIAERIECLPDHLHALLVSIAVAGRGCRTDALSHLHGISRLHAAALGDALVERHLAVEEDGVYRCAHPIIANVVRGRVSASRRREVHRALALTLELLLPKGRSPEGSDAGEIARHAEQAGDRPLAYRYALVASDACSQRCAYDEALAWLDLASGAADTPDESDLVDRTTARILELAGWREVPPVRAPVSSPLRGVEPSDLDLPTRALG